MKHFKFILPLVLILLSCSSDSVQTTENTQLEITIKDENNNPVENSIVNLYATQNDSDNETNTVQTLTTNANGKVTFQNLQTIKYYWKTSKQCYSYTEDNSVNSIVNNILNSFITIQPSNFVGNISLFNNTTSEYTFTINGPSPATTDTFNIMPNTPVLVLDSWETGNYTYSYTPVGGTTTTTSSFVLDCGEEINIVIN